MRLFIILLLISISLNSTQRFDFILKEVIKFQEFRNEFHENFLLKKEQNEENWSKLDLEDQKKFKIACNKTIEQGTILIDELYKKSEDISSDANKAVRLLEFLLIKRFELLHATALNAESLSSSSVVIPIQDSDLCHKYYKKKKSASYDLEFYDYVKDNNIYLYQFKVLLIKKIFQSLKSEELSEEAIKLLRASVQLSDILTNKTTELGCVDHCGGYLKCMIYSNDFNYTHSKAAVAISNNIISKTWEKNKKLYDIYWYDAHFIKKERVEPFKGLGVPKNHGIKRYTTDREEGLVDDLPFPNCLKESCEIPFQEFESFFATTNFNDFDDTIEEEIPFLEQDISVELTKTKPIKTDVKKDFIPPAGLRKFHNLLPDSPYEKLKLKKKHQEFIDKIFSYKQFVTISYLDFKNFWENIIGGKIIGNRKTSHKQLLGPNNEPLGGISAHNDNHTYGKNTIKYLRAALYYVGARPSSYLYSKLFYL